ncbi:MAG TPA: AMP-binding protein [Myxococcota bacterium]|nr:AMP-binding protein [Myxococcota bacterium]
MEREAASGEIDLLHALGLGEVLAEHGRSDPQQTAWVCGKSRYSYAQADARVSRLADLLRAEGVQPGDRILWLGQNCHRLLEALLAAAKIGAVFCPANWRQTADELAFVLEDLAPSVVLWQDEEIGSAVRAARERSPSARLWIQHDGSGEGSYERFVEREGPALAAPSVDPSKPVLALYTAAFGGRPNAALLSHTALLLQALVISKVQDIGRDFVYLNCGPLFHVATLMTTFATFLWGGTNVFTRRVDAEELCRLIEAERCTGAFVMPPTMQQMVEVNRERKYDLASLRSFRALPAWNEMTSEDTSPWGRRPGGYGQTEATGMVTLAALGSTAAGSHGRSIPLLQVRIVDPEGREVAPGEVGEIVARGPTLMRGYHGRREETSARQAGGWHHTNDLGRREADGSLSFIGPKTRLIKSAAENIYPVEVENCLRHHPGVADCAVIGRPDRTWGQSVMAIVVRKLGDSVTAEELVEHCRARIASYKKPRVVEFVEQLPRRGFAVDYEALDRKFGGGGYPGVQGGAR